MRQKKATDHNGRSIEQRGCTIPTSAAPLLKFFAAMMALLIGGSLTLAADNLVQNYDFSQGVGANDAPIHWNVGQDSEDMSIFLSSERSVRGPFSVHFVDRDPTGALALRSDPMIIQPNQQYRAAVDVWVTSGTAMLYMEFRTADGTRITVPRVMSRMTDQWESLEIQAQAPADAQYVTILLYSDKANVGEAFFDFVRLTSNDALSFHEERLNIDLPVADDQLDYAPADGVRVSSNPPSFIWIPVPGATHYELDYSTDPHFAEDLTYVVDGIDLSVYTPNHTLDPNEVWYWRVHGVDAEGNVGPPSITRAFSIDQAAVELPLPSPDEIRARIGPDHPRLFVTPETLPAFKEMRTANLLFKEILWRNLQSTARSLLFSPLSKEPPHARPGGVRDINLWRQYTSAVEATNNVETLAFVYMLTGDTEIGEAVRKWMMHIAAWDPQGATSAAVNDEASMPILHKLSRAYTWAYDVFTPEERQIILDVMRARGNEAYRILKARPFESRPYGSHAARQLGFLLEPAIAFLGEIPEAQEWFDYVVRVIFAVYPAWGGDPGGWAEGQAYWSSYINRALWFVDVLREATGLDLFEKAFFRNNGYFKLYTHPPYARISPFGDHADRSPTTTDGNIMRQYAVRYDNPHFQWYAEQMGGGIEQGVMGYIRAALRPPFQVRGKAPLDLPPSRYFSDIGWVAMHRILGDPNDAIQFMFKSSPYGSWSHSMADQNTFTLEAYGEPLAISSGYRPFYGSDHHMGWTKTTQAHNGILVNGQGQPVQSIDAQGTITGFVNGNSFDYTGGDATQAYPGLLDRALRHVVYLRPDTFIVFDDLLAPRPSQYSWLLHAYQPFQFDESIGTLAVYAPKATLQARLWGSDSLSFAQTNEFAVPLDEPMNVAEQWHFTATTSTPAYDGQFVAVLRPSKADDDTTFVAQEQTLSAGRGIHIAVNDVEAEILFRTQDGLLETAALRSDGHVAAWTQTDRTSGLLVVQGTELQTESGHQLASDVAIDAEFTFATNTEGMLSSITGAVDTSRVADEVVSVALTVPGLRTPQHVAADVPITWEVVDETLHLQLQSAAVLNRIVMDM